LKKYTHLTLEERERLFSWREQGESIREIARRLRRHHSTINAEIKRNTKYGVEYLPCNAQHRYKRIAKKQRRRAPLKNPAVFVYVREHLRGPYYWTPQLISGRLTKQSKGKITISVECIYQYIYSKGAKEYKLWEHLPYTRKKRKLRTGRGAHKKGKAPNAVSIEKRPEYIQKRKQGGHWETDNMEGPKSDKTALSVTIERASRVSLLSRLPNQTKDEKTRVVVGRLRSQPNEIVRTLTMDNGKENYGHEVISDSLDLKVYFCHAYASWEKGSVERRIREIRRFVPKGRSLVGLTNADILWLEDWLNNRPMVCLNYATPRERMSELLSKP